MGFLFNDEFTIENHGVGFGHRAYIIAEAGVAHFGRLQKAFQLVDLAQKAGANAVKFQTFKIDELISVESQEWRDRLSNRCLSYDNFKKLKTYCQKKGITFLSTPHDEQSLDFLDELDVPAFKIGSGECRNWPFIEKIAKKNKPIILSTGMYDMAQVGNALEVIASSGNKNLAVLHCTTSYPSPAEDINLMAMDKIKEKYQVIVGYSDHTSGFHIPLAAVARGASVIEKHITLEYDIPDAQDWKVSCGPENLAAFVNQIREIEVSIGKGNKAPTKLEEKNMFWATKSIVANVDICAGECLKEEHLASKRPGGGISPSDKSKIIGKKINKPVKKDIRIFFEDLYE